MGGDSEGGGGGVGPSATWSWRQEGGGVCGVVWGGPSASWLGRWVNTSGLLCRSCFAATTLLTAAPPRTTTTLPARPADRFLARSDTPWPIV